MLFACEDEEVTGPTHLSTPTGWREWVAMPGIGVPWVKAKIDTGARSSALHAFGVTEFEHDGGPWVSFIVHPLQNSARDEVEVTLPVHDRRVVRSSSGHTQRRIVVLLDLVVAARPITAEVTLSNRDRMGFRMLIGREALRQGFLVDPGRSYLGPRPPKAIRRRHRATG
nr:RimK/LysX family protein [Occultella kanbiaonis]